MLCNLPTKFEVFTFTRYGDMKCVKNAQNGVVSLVWVVRGHPRSSAMSPFDRAHIISYSSLIETTVCVYLETFSRYGELFVEIRQLKFVNFDLRYLHLAPSLALHWPRWNFENIFGIRKLESVGYRAALFAC